MYRQTIPIKIHFAPIQGITDYFFRSAFAHFFDGVDCFYTPYLRLTKGQEIKSSQYKDVLPENNNELPIIPQIMTNNHSDFLFLAETLHNLGYSTINWNLGCPYPMVTKRNLGAGMLDKPQFISDLLTEVFDELQPKLSIKIRSGLLAENEILNLLPLLNNFAISDLIIHPRIAKLLYKGNANVEIFKQSIPISKHNLTYNGDIKTLSDFQDKQAQLPSTQSWMLGRGLIANPFLAEQIKSNSLLTDRNKMSIFTEFHDSLWEHYSQAYYGNTQILNKMRGLWEYFSFSFSNSHKVYKRIKKAKTVEAYQQAVSINIRSESWLA